MDFTVPLTLPAYYFENAYLDNKINDIRNAIDACDGDADVFIFITDIHWNMNTQRSPAIIRYLCEQISVPRLFKGGDDHHIGLHRYANYALATAFPGRIYSACGEHEYFYGITGEEIRDIFDVKGEVVFGDPVRNYYYVENTAQKTRYIVLNAFSAQHGDEAWKKVPGYDSAQCDWFANTALQVEEGWTVLIFTHCLFGWRPEDDTMSLMTELHADAIATVIEQYKGPGTIAAVIQGHTHRDRILHIGSVPVLVTASDECRPYFEPVDFPNPDADRAVDTVREQAFDVCVLDKKARKLTAIRIGAKAKDLDGNQCEMRVVSY